MNLPSVNEEMSIAFDVDSTLIMHDKPETHDLEFIDPYDGTKQTARIHTRHVDFLIRSRQQGYKIVVWSAGGKAYADVIVDALKIRPYVDLVLCKFIKFVDDLEANDILVNRIYIKEEGHK